MITMKTIIILFIMISSIVNAQNIDKSILTKIKKVEGGKPGMKVLDSNNKYSYGTYQIQEPYLKDANDYLKTDYTIDQVKDDDKIAEAVVIGYITRYSKYYEKVNKTKPSEKIMLMMHNGGGTIWKRPNSKAYQNAEKYANKALNK